MRLAALLLALSLVIPLNAQMWTLSREEMIKYTPNNPYDRFPDGRPKVPDDLLEQVRGLTMEEVWGLLPRKGFPNFYEGGWQILHPEKKLVGRAVTAMFMPLRDDVNNIMEADAKAAKKSRPAHQMVIDSLQPGDVLVVDMMGKTEDGIVGDNLATAVYAATKAGFVVDGAIRDLEGIFPIPMSAYFRAAHPGAIRNVMLVAVNTPIRIGKAVVMPGDVVLGDREGISFIPPAMVKPILDTAVETHIHDEWTKGKFMTGKYKSTDLYSRPKDPALIKEYEEYKKKKMGK
jgi:regulator of RNase E activity RraA